MAIKRRVEKVIAARATHICPISCDSTVQYKVISGRHGLWGTVQLADCNRKIEWYFRNGDDVKAKMDTAIQALQEFRDTFLAAQSAERAAKRKKRVA